MTIHQQIFQAIENDPAAIREVANAVVASDPAALQAVLAARGIELASAEAEAMLATARGGGLGAANTITMTIT